MYSTLNMLPSSVSNLITCHAQDFLASVEHSTALQRAQQVKQEALQQEIDSMQTHHAQALRVAARETEALSQVILQT